MLLLTMQGLLHCDMVMNGQSAALEYEDHWGNFWSEFGL